MICVNFLKNKLKNRNSITKIKLRRNCKSANLSNLQNGPQRQAQISKFSFKRKRTAWNKRKDKTMALDTQAKIVASDIGSFCNQREWSEFYYGESINYYQK